ncbi:MAG: hypothetical protein Ct9H300mP1_14070 [Planctomycetaceae bacterium]|nr:MAG: hypothetical protein Ct9H300mP1_14070 [Planctomycetaceae bacterium]
MSGTLFEASGQTQINEMIENGLAGANNLKGLQRTKPMGAMLFLAPGLPPTPFLVSYVPVANIEELIQTIGGGGNTVLRRVEGETDRFELVGQNGNEQQIVLRAVTRSSARTPGTPTRNSSTPGPN